MRSCFLLATALLTFQLLVVADPLNTAQATPAFTLELNQVYGDFNFTGGALYYKDNSINSSECATHRWYESSGSDCINTYDYQDTYVAYFYPNGPVERAIVLTFYLNSEIKDGGFNASAFLDVVSSQLNVTIDRLTNPVVKGETESGQVQVNVGFKDSKAWERDLVDRWAIEAYADEFAPEFFVEAISYAEPGPDVPSSSAARVQVPLVSMLLQWAV